MNFFEDFACVLQIILLTKIKKILMSVLGLNSKDRKSTGDKANISNPKVNRGCAPLTANRISADCVQISFGSSIPYIPLGVYHTGGFNAMSNKTNCIEFHLKPNVPCSSDPDHSVKTILQGSSLWGITRSAVRLDLLTAIRTCMSNYSHRFI